MSLLVFSYLLYLSCVYCVQALHQFSYHIIHGRVEQKNHVFRNDFFAQKNTIHYTKPYNAERYYELCQQKETSKGFKIGFIIDRDLFGENRKNCYYLCNEQIDLEMINFQYDNQNQRFHCCPSGYHIDYDKQLCADNELLLDRNRRRLKIKNRISNKHRIEKNFSKQSYIDNFERIRKVASNKPSVRIIHRKKGTKTQIIEPTIKDVGKCEKNYKKHYECNKYWQCVLNRFEVEMICPSGLYWNENRNHCDINRNVHCAKDLPTLNDIINDQNHNYLIWNRKNSTNKFQDSKVNQNINSTNNHESSLRFNNKSSTNLKNKWFLKRIVANQEKNTKSYPAESMNSMNVRCLNKWQAAFFRKKYAIQCPINHISVNEFRKNFGTKRRFWTNSTKGGVIKTNDGTKNKPSTTESPIIIKKITTTSEPEEVIPITSIPDVTSLEKVNSDSQTSTTTTTAAAATTTTEVATITAATTTTVTTTTTAETTKETAATTTETVATAAAAATTTTETITKTTTEAAAAETTTTEEAASSTTTSIKSTLFPSTETPNQSLEPVTTDQPTTELSITELPMNKLPTAELPMNKLPTTELSITELPMNKLPTTTVQTSQSSTDESKIETSTAESSDQVTISSESSTVTEAQISTEAGTIISDVKSTEIIESSTTSSSTTELSSTEHLENSDESTSTLELSTSPSTTKTTTAITTITSTQSSAELTTVSSISSETATVITTTTITPTTTEAATTIPTTTEATTTRHSNIESDDEINTTPIITTTLSTTEISVITLPNNIRNNVTSDTTTPFFDGIIKENGPCIHPGQRFKDEDDCQCFYECEFNRKLVRNCCPEGLLFNQNEEIPSNSDESEGDDAVCDLPENVQCTSIIS